VIDVARLLLGHLSVGHDVGHVVTCIVFKHIFNLLWRRYLLSMQIRLPIIPVLETRALGHSIMVIRDFYPTFLGQLMQGTELPRPIGACVAPEMDDKTYCEDNFQEAEAPQDQIDEVLQCALDGGWVPHRTAILGREEGLREPILVDG
jgi:hypothetical protein